MPESFNHLIYVNQVVAGEASGQGARELGFISALIQSNPHFSFSLFVARTDQRRFEDPRVTEIPFRSRSAFSYVRYQIVLLLLLGWELVRHPGAVIHMRFSPPMVAPVLAAWLFRKPLVVRTGPTFGMFAKCHPPGPIRWLLSRACDWTLRRSEAIVVVSEEIKTAIVNRHGLDPLRVSVIPNGVSPDFGARVEQQRCAGLEAVDRIVGYAGSVDEDQGLKTLIAAAPAIVRDNNRTAFLIVGGGPWLPEFRRQVAESPAANRFVITGAVPHEKVAGFIHQCDVMIAPFDPRSFEGRGSSPIKLWEYLACGKPVVISRHPDHQFLEDQGLGLQFDGTSASDLAAKVLMAVRLPAEKKRIMGAAAKAFVAEHRSWPAIVNRIVTVCGVT